MKLLLKITFSLTLTLLICIPQQSIFVEVRGFLKLHWLQTNSLPSLNLNFKGTSELGGGGKRFKNPRQTSGSKLEASLGTCYPVSKKERKKEKKKRDFEVQVSTEYPP